MQEIESLEPNNVFKKLVITQYTLFGVFFSISMIVGAFIDTLPILYAGIAGFIGLTLYILASYYTQIVIPEKPGTKMSFGSGFLHSMLRILVFIAVFVSVICVATFVPVDNTFTSSDMSDLINVWLVIIYLSIPMISSFVYQFSLKNK